ncbi:MAG: hypothetical protein WDN24_16935 [Sphingomonas sp.]
MRSLYFLCALALAGCTAATPSPRPIGTPDGVPADCPLTVTFASYGAGIDSGALEAVEKLLAGVPVTRHRWGREGEVTLCARPASDGEALFRRIKTVFPARPRGPLSVSTADGRVFVAPPAE